MFDNKTTLSDYNNSIIYLWDLCYGGLIMKDPMKKKIKELDSMIKKVGKGSKVKVPKMPKPRKSRRAI